MQNRLRGSGHGVAAARMDAKLNSAGWIAEQMGGIRLDFMSVFMCHFIQPICILKLGKTHIAKRTMGNEDTKCFRKKGFLFH